MAEQESDQSKTSEPSISFEVFQEYFKTNPDLDNSEYYNAFPKVNQGTIRSWKSRASKATTPDNSNQHSTPKDQPPSSTPPDEKMLDGTINNLITAINMIPGKHIDEKILEGMDKNSQVVLLQNMIQDIHKNRSTGNANILPISTGISQPGFWVDNYITMNPEKQTVEMRIPASELVKKANERSKEKKNTPIIIWD
jgi:hypothetical protein